MTTVKNEAVKPTPKTVEATPKTVKHDVMVHVDDPQPYWAGCSCGWRSDGYSFKEDAAFIGAAHRKGGN